MKKILFLGIYLFTGYVVFSQIYFNIDAGIGFSTAIISYEKTVANPYSANSYLTSGESLPFNSFSMECNVEALIDSWDPDGKLGMGFNFLKNFNEDFNYSHINIYLLADYYFRNIHSTITIGVGFGFMFYNAREGVFIQEKYTSPTSYHYGDYKMISNNGIVYTIPINITLRKFFSNGIYVFGRGNIDVLLVTHHGQFDGFTLGILAGIGIAF
jgi:subtilisin family serine protease